MATDKAYPQSTALSKTGSTDISVSDLRKSSHSFKVFAKGTETREDIVKATSAMLMDLSEGKITVQEASAYCGVLDRNLHVKDQELSEMEMQLRLELTGRRAKVTKSRVPR